MKRIKYVCIIFFIILISFASKVNAANVKVNKVKGISLKSQTTNSIKIKWRKINKVSGYQVYIYNTKTKKYDLYKTTKKTELNLKNLKSAQNYKIKIRGYKKINQKKYYGKYSSVYQACTIPEKISKLKATDISMNNVNISWNKVSKAKGYEVYICSNNIGKYIKYKDTKNNKLNINQLDSSKKYNIKVRAYIKLNNKKYYSKFSYVLSFVTKNDTKSEKEKLLKLYYEAEKNYLEAVNNVLNKKAELSNLKENLSKQKQLMLDLKVELKSAQNKLEIVRNQKNTQVYVEGKGFVWQADPVAVSRAQEYVVYINRLIESLNSDINVTQEAIELKEDEIDLATNLEEQYKRIYVEYKSKI